MDMNDNTDRDGLPRWALWLGGALVLGALTFSALSQGATAPKVVPPTALAAARSVAPTAVPAPAVTATPAVPESVKASAVSLLGAAASQRQAGQLGLALELGNQALARWPAYPDAQSFLAEVRPQATAAAGQAIAEATARAGAVATAQAQAAAAAAVAAEEAARPKTLGQPFSAGNWEYTVLDVRRGRQIGTTSFHDTAKGQYILVGVILKNLGRENFGISAHDFTLFDGNGIKYNTASLFAGNHWIETNGYPGGAIWLSTGQMPPGVPVKYAVVFDVAPGSTGLSLSLNQARTSVPLGEPRARPGA